MEERSTKDMISVGKRLIAGRQYAKAFKIFKALHERIDSAGDDEKALIQSYFGLLMVRHQRQWDEGHRLCEEALKAQFYLPETYVNLARIYLDRKLPPFQRKAEKLLTDALKVDPENREAQAEMLRIHGNKFQALSFLSAENPVNLILARILGKG